MGAASGARQFRLRAATSAITMIPLCGTAAPTAQPVSLAPRQPRALHWPSGITRDPWADHLPLRPARVRLVGWRQPGRHDGLARIAFFRPHHFCPKRHPRAARNLERWVCSGGALGRHFCLARCQSPYHAFLERDGGGTLGLRRWQGPPIRHRLSGLQPTRLRATQRQPAAPLAASIRSLPTAAAGPGRCRHTRLRRHARLAVVSPAAASTHSAEGSLVAILSVVVASTVAGLAGAVSTAAADVERQWLSRGPIAANQCTARCGPPGISLEPTSVVVAGDIARRTMEREIRWVPVTLAALLLSIA